MKYIPHSSALSSIMYLMICTRPDIAYTTSIINRFMSNSGKRHWEAVTWVLRYLKGTSSIALSFKKSKADLHGFVDVDFAEDIDQRRSLSGYLFFVGENIIS